MNKQEKEELVNQLNGRLTNCPSDSWYKGYNEGIKTAGIVVRNMHTADEPQKVKVPEEFGEWFLQIKQKWGKAAERFALWKICQYGFGHGFEDVKNELTSKTLSDWVCFHKNDAVNAVLNGYEVEEEPKWVVKSNRLYFTGITQLIAREPITYNFTTDEKRAHVFDDKESAEKEASFFDGTVEKVEE